MTRMQFWLPLAVACLLCLPTLSCSPTQHRGPSEESAVANVPTSLLDGVYPVLPEDRKIAEIDSGSPIVELLTVPIPGSDDPTAKLQIIGDRPLVLFRETPQFDFTFVNDTCTAIGFQNTDALQAYTRDHLGAHLAVVIDGKVISEHKIRESIESELVRITSCSVGGGDHLHAHLKELKLASKSN